MRSLILIAAVLLAGPALAQHASPYAGFEARPVKSLSDKDLADLREGRGMGLALPAELNGYPGPSHVLELADGLHLTAEQRTRTKELFERMKAEAVAAGERVVAGEAALERLFADRTATPQALEAAVLDAGESKARLRLTHLKYHIAMLELLTPEQVARYGELRGYAGAGHHGGHKHGAH